MQLHIELGSLAQSRLNVPYLCYLTAYMEVYEPQRVVQVLLVENSESLEQLARRESELARVTSAVLPFARSARGEFYPYAEPASSPRLNFLPCEIISSTTGCIWFTFIG